VHSVVEVASRVDGNRVVHKQVATVVVRSTEAEAHSTVEEVARQRAGVVGRLTVEVEHRLVVRQVVAGRTSSYRSYIEISMNAVSSDCI